MISKASSLLKKYSAEWKVIQLYEEASAGTTVTETYSVPSSKVFIPINVTIGSQQIGNMKTTLNIDGTLLLDNLVSTTALEHVFDVLTIESNSYVTLQVQNTDISAHAADIILMGFLITRSDLEKFYDDLREDDDSKLYTNIDKNITTLITQMNLIGTQLGANMSSTAPATPAGGTTTGTGEPGGGYI